MEPGDFRPLARSRADRARTLADRFEASREGLNFARTVFLLQEEIAPRARRWEELPDLGQPVIQRILETAPPPLCQAVVELDQVSFRASLENYWHRVETASPDTLPARLVLQPYAFQQPGASGGAGTGTCPRCGHSPQAGILRPAGHGKALELCCSLCLHEWPFPRGTCPGCQKSGPGVLDFYSSEQMPGRQVQACRLCRAYLHVLDLEQLPDAVPDVDEMAALPLDVWATQESYRKLQVNLVGI